jgi:hypothetical protein
MDPERMMSEAMRAQGGVGRPPAPGSRRPMPPPRPFPVGWVLMIALLAGAVAGVALALISIFMPGVLPVLGVR